MYIFQLPEYTQFIHNLHCELFAYWIILHAFLSSVEFLQNQLFRKIISGIPSECQTILF